MKDNVNETLSHNKGGVRRILDLLFSRAISSLL
jgi:hypothetical protein